VPTISRFYGIVIEMWWNEHPPAHFHARYAEHRASISIDNLTVVEGALPHQAMRLVREWALLHRDELMDNWLRARAQQPLRSIDPLA
jgi:hypothetical protein